MRKVVILGSLLVLAMGSANCAGDRNSEESSSSITGPAGVDGKPSGGGGGKPSGGSSSSVAYQLVNDVNGDGAPNAGDTVTFNVSTTATTEPHVSLACSQGGAVVFTAQTGYYSTYPWPWTQTMTLWSQAWPGGAATCTAKLYYFSGTKTPTLATQTFSVAE